MKTIDIARRAARGLRNAKARTILTSLAIAVGAFTITISLAAGEGARQYADKLINSNVNPRALFIVKDDSLFNGGIQAGGLKEYDPDAATTNTGVTIKQITQADVDKLSARDDLEYVTPTYSPQVQYIQFGDSDKKFKSDIAPYDPTITSEVSKGTLPPKGEQINNTSAIIPESFAETLVELKVIKSVDDVVGKTVALTAVKAAASPTSEQIAAAFAEGGEKALQNLVQGETKVFSYKITALSKRSATALTGSTAIQISSDSAREISEYTTFGTSNYQKYIGVTTLSKQGEDAEAIKAELKGQGLYAQTAKDLQAVIFTVVNTLQGIVLGFGIVALIASIFGIINTQYISVLERTREIGLMKALGMRGRSVSRLFQFEAAWIGFLGGIIGVIIAVLLGTVLNPWITNAIELGEGNSILIFQPIPIALMILSLIIIAMLAGWFPARKAAKLDPIEALRTE